MAGTEHIDHEQPATVTRGLGAMHIGLRIALIAGVALAASSCGRGTVPAERLAQITSEFNKLMIERDPLCIDAGPFPVGTGAVKGTCDRCQELAQAGLLSRRIVENADGGYVEYSLSAEGNAVYREDPDPEYVEIVRVRFAKQGDPDHRVDPDALTRPRLCFGQTRFHSVTDALAPMSVAGSSYVGVKLVAEATDTSKRLFDPRIATLGLPIPPRPEPGHPALYPAQVMTFQVFTDGSLEVSDMRYGAWVNEP